MNLQTVRSFLIESNLDGWLVYDFRGNNAVLAELLPGQRWTTRRLALYIPATGEPRLIVHNIDAPQFVLAGVMQTIYTDRHQWQAHIAGLAGGKKIAMEFSPLGELPAIAVVDAGVVDWLRTLGTQVVSSQDLIQIAVARWSPAAVEAHHRCSAITNQVKDDAFKLISDRVRAGTAVTELDVQRFILQRFESAGLDPDHPPIVGANANSGDPHFAVSQTAPARINVGDWVLIDLWARYPGREHIFADITWVGFVGSQLPEKHARVFRSVAAARDAAIKLAVDRWQANKPVRGCELDAAARAVFIADGYEQNIRHRTGHSLSPGPKVHGLGANLDDFETHDTRQILPHTGFTIEPALYFADFGCRSEINVYVDPACGPVLTSGLQESVLML